MTKPPVTIVVVPRERFSLAMRSLESLFEHTDFPFSMIYIDGGSPDAVRRHLIAQSRRRGFHLIRTDRYLSPNQARNLAIRHVETKYVVFVDNDLVVSPGWLEALHRCAEETKGWVVGPIYCIGKPEHEIVHMAGGIARIQELDEKRHLLEKHLFVGEHLSGVHPILRRESCELVEFHCMLVRMETFRCLGLLDENLLSSPEHIDLCLSVRGVGREIYFEPAAVVSYIPPPPFAWYDIAYFVLRWSEAWNRSSLDHFRRKWNLSRDDPFLADHSMWLRSHRQLLLASLQALLCRVCGRKAVRWIDRRLLSPAEVVANRLLIGGRKVPRIDAQVSSP